MPENSWLHRSEDWGGKAHVDKYVRDVQGNIVLESHGHSPTLNPPPTNQYGHIKIKSTNDLPPPYGRT